MDAPKRSILRIMSFVNGSLTGKARWASVGGKSCLDVRSRITAAGPAIAGECVA